jgi:hypothetical protein
MLGCGAASVASTPPRQATLPARDPEEVRALLGYHLGLLAQRIDMQCPERALPSVLDTGAEGLPPCAADVNAEEAMLMGWLEQPPQIEALGEPQVLPTDEACEAPDPRELRAALDLAVALRHRLREETDAESVAAITLRALVRQQLTTALDRKWTVADVGVADQARALIPRTSRESTSEQVHAIFARAALEHEQACLMEDASADPWSHPESWVRGQFLETPATITGPRILFQPTLFNYDGVIFIVLSSRQSLDATLAAMAGAGARIPWPGDATPRPGAALFQREVGELIHLHVLLPGATEHMVVHASIAQGDDARLHNLILALATLSLPPQGEIFDAPIAIDDPALTWRSSSTLFAPSWTWTEEPLLFDAPRHMTVAAVLFPALGDPCTQNGIVSTPVERFGLRGCEIVGLEGGLHTVTTMLTYGNQLLSITAAYPDNPGTTEASVLTSAHRLLDRVRLLGEP